MLRLKLWWDRMTRYRSGMFRVVFQGQRNRDRVFRSEPMSYDMARDFAFITGGTMERCDADA